MGPKVPVTILELLLKIGFRMIAGGMHRRHGDDDGLGHAFERAAEIFKADGIIEAQEVGALIEIMLTPRRDHEELSAAAADERRPDHLEATRKLRRRQRGQAFLMTVVTLVAGGMDAIDDALTAIADQDGDGQVDEDEVEDLQRLRAEIGKIRRPARA